MELIKHIKAELEGFGQYERVLFPLVILLIIFISFITNDNKIALVSAVCGISYTILAGKGRVLCYFMGIAGTICYSYLAFINGFYGNLALYSLYYLPMEIIGIYKWRRHLKREKREIIKTKLNNNEKLIYLICTTIMALIVFIVLRYLGASTPLFDGVSTVFSVTGQLLTVKRCIEQWYVWFFVNIFSMIMWIIAYINGSNCLATVIMWGVYVILSIYFLEEWQKEIRPNKISR